MNVRMHSYELRIDFFFHTCFGLDLKCVCIHTNPPLAKGDLGGFFKFQMRMLVPPLAGRTFIRIPPSPHFFRGDVNNYMLPLVTKNKALLIKSASASLNRFIFFIGSIYSSFFSFIWNLHLIMSSHKGLGIVVVCFLRSKGDGTIERFNQKDSASFSSK